MPAPALGHSEIDTPPGEPAGANEPSMGLYVHWPFCLAKCPYCDFNSHVREAIDQARWRKAYLAELEHVAASTPSRRLESIFFGGGTPSLLEPETVAAIIERAFALWPSAPGSPGPSGPPPRRPAARAQRRRPGSGWPWPVRKW